MNLLIIPSWYPSKGMPGNGIFFREQAIALAKKGHNVTLIDVSFHGRKDTFNFRNFQFSYKNDEGVHTYSFKIPSFFVLSRILFIHIWLFKSLLFCVFKKLLKKGLTFDVIHAHSFCPAGYCASILSKRYDIPLVVTEHSTGVQNKQLIKKEKEILEDVVNSCEAFICVSEALKQSIITQVHINKELNVIPNMYSPIFSYSDSNSKKNKPEFVFLSTGILTERKQHAFTISCFMEAFKDDSNVKLQIAGEGELYNTLKKQISYANLNGKVELLGWLNKEQLAEKMKESDAFVLASVVETFGIVYTEALACGKPVIATKNGGANDIINETNGILIGLDNKNELIKAFRFMYANASSYDSEQIAKNCAAKYSENAITQTLSDIYNKITHQK